MHLEHIDLHKPSMHIKNTKITWKQGQKKEVMGESAVVNGCDKTVADFQTINTGKACAFLRSLAHIKD